MNVSPVRINEMVTRESGLLRPLNVCFYVFFPAGGIGRYTSELTRAVNALTDVSAEVVCTPEYQWKDDAGYDSWAGLQSISHMIPTLRRYRFLQGQFINPRRCIKHAKKTGARIIHFSNINHLSFPFWKQPLLDSGIKVAVTAHDVRRQKSIINRRWEERQLIAFYQFADALFVHSEYQANELVEFAGVSPKKIHVVPHGPYPHQPAHKSREAMRASLGIKPDVKLGLFFGQIRDEKNLDHLIEALSLSTSEPHLLVAGRGAGRHHKNVEYYQSLARKLGVDNQITFIAKFIPDKEVGALFEASDWVALPYDKSFTSQSGVLNVAAHFERPVLVSSSPVLKETVETCDIGIICGNDSTSDLARSIDIMSERVDEGYTYQFKEYRALYSWEENARLSLKIYRDITSNVL